MRVIAHACVSDHYAVSVCSLHVCRCSVVVHVSYSNPTEVGRELFGLIERSHLRKEPWRHVSLVNVK